MYRFSLISFHYFSLVVLLRFFLAHQSHLITIHVLFVFYSLKRKEAEEYQRQRQQRLWIKSKIEKYDDVNRSIGISSRLFCLFLINFSIRRKRRIATQRNAWESRFRCGAASYQSNMVNYIVHTATCTEHSVCTCEKKENQLPYISSFRHIQ